MTEEEKRLERRWRNRRSIILHTLRTKPSAWPTLDQLPQADVSDLVKVHDEMAHDDGVEND
jgi:hypothetical protein